MRKGFRPSLEPPTHRKAVVEARRPGLCLFVTSAVILLVFAIFAVSGWNVYVHRFDSNMQYFHARDEVSLNEISNDLSSVFCDGYEVVLNGPGHVYLLPKQANVDTKHIDEMPVELYQMSNRVLNVKTLYLLTESTVDVSACRERASSQPFAEIVFIRGDSNLQNWRKNSDCESCILARTFIPDNTLCGNKDERNMARLLYRVKANDRYYLAIYFGKSQIRSHMSGPGIMLKGVLKRTHFDVAKAEKVCSTTHCPFDLPWMSEKDVVVRLEGSPWSNNGKFTTQCQTRVVFWVCLFGILPVVCVIPVSILLGCFLCRRTRRNARAVIKKQEEKSKIRMGKGRGEINYVAQVDDYGSVVIQDG